MRHGLTGLISNHSTRGVLLFIFGDIQHPPHVPYGEDDVHVLTFGTPLTSLPTPITPTVNIFRNCSAQPQQCRSNCRRIEIPLLLPSGYFKDLNSEHVGDTQQNSGTATTGAPEKSNDENASHAFPFLTLPFEIRLQIYALLLPSRRHIIVTQRPQNGSYYSETPMYSASSLYPAWPGHFRPPPQQQQQQQQAGATNHPAKLTTYSVTNANSGLDLPLPSIHAQILRVNRQVHDEAEPVLYGRETVFDFGVHADAVVPFFSDRSRRSRSYVRKVSLAAEMFGGAAVLKGGVGPVDPMWNDVGDFLGRECLNLRVVDLTICEVGKVLDYRAVFPPPPFVPATAPILGTENAALSAEGNAKAMISAEDDRMDREWNLTLALLRSESREPFKVTWWETLDVDTTFRKRAAWLASRLGVDYILRESKVMGGCIVEGLSIM